MKFLFKIITIPIIAIVLSIGLHFNNERLRNGDLKKTEDEFFAISKVYSNCGPPGYPGMFFDTFVTFYQNISSGYRTGIIYSDGDDFFLPRGRTRFLETWPYIVAQLKSQCEKYGAK